MPKKDIVEVEEDAMGALPAHVKAGDGDPARIQQVSLRDGLRGSP
jgi:hypothetical protein